MDQPAVNNDDLVMEGAEYTRTVDERVSRLPPGHYLDFMPVAMHSIVRIAALSTESMALAIRPLLTAIRFHIYRNAQSYPLSDSVHGE